MNFARQIAEFPLENISALVFGVCHGVGVRVPVCLVVFYTICWLGV